MAALAATSAPVAPGMMPNGLPPGVTLATDIPGEKNSHPYYVVDPKVEAAVAEPLPLPDAGTHPIVGKITPALQTSPLASVSRPLVKISAAPLVAVQPPPPEPTPDTELEHRGLLLGE